MGTNFNSHCEYCRGSHPMESYIHEAIKKRLTIYGFSSHAPLLFDCEWAMPYQDLAQYLEEGQHLKKKFRDLIEIHIGLEVDFIPGVTSPLSPFIQSLKLDYVIGSIHFVGQLKNGKYWQFDHSLANFKKGLKEIYKGNIKKMVQEYYALLRKMLKEECPEILGHLDRVKCFNAKNRFFNEKDAWYRKEVRATLKTLAKSGSILELNTRDIDTKKARIYPSPWILSEAYEWKIPVMINSDADRPSEVDRGFEEARALLLKIGYTKQKVLKNGLWQSTAL